LSTVGLDRLEKSIRSPVAIMALVQRLSSALSSPRKKMAIAIADICSSLTTPSV